MPNLAKCCNRSSHFFFINFLTNFLESQHFSGDKIKHQVFQYFLKIMEAESWDVRKFDFFLWKQKNLKNIYFQTLVLKILNSF